MNGNQQMQDSSKLILMAKGRGTKQNKRKTKKHFFNITCFAFLLSCSAQGSVCSWFFNFMLFISLFIYFFCFIFLLIPQSFICLFIVDIVVVLLSSLKEIISLVPRKP